jgi:hypothetical protein
MVQGLSGSSLHGSRSSNLDFTPIEKIDDSKNDQDDNDDPNQNRRDATQEKQE